MGFGNIGIGELMMILLVVMVVFGPKRMPEIARNMGKFMRDFRRETNAAIKELKDGIEPIKVGIFDEPDATTAVADGAHVDGGAAPLPGVSAAAGAGTVAFSPAPAPGNGRRKPAAGRQKTARARKPATAAVTATARRKTSAASSARRKTSTPATTKKRPAQKAPKGKRTSPARSGASRKR